MRHGHHYEVLVGVLITVIVKILGKRLDVFDLLYVVDNLPQILHQTFSDPVVLEWLAVLYLDDLLFHLI